MFKFVNKKRIAGLVAALICFIAVVGASVSSAFAYKPSYYDEYRMGSDNYGIFQSYEDPSVYVKKMKLIYDIPSLPQVDDYSDINYRSKVTSEYTLYNPADEAVSVRLFAQEMERPNYFGNNPDVTPSIKVNGEEVETVVRHFALTVSDEWYSDAFFNPDLPVHTYKINASPNLTYAYLKGDIISDFTKARYIADDSNEFSCRYTTDGENNFYILGDDTAVNFDALSFYDYDRYELVKINDLFTLEKVETTTLKELVLKSLRPVDGISELDWYNGILASFSNSECVCSKYALTASNLRKYYQYTVDIAPKGEIVTSVTTPVYPNVLSSSNCDYFYNIEDSAWGGFGKLEVEINTDFYIASNAENFQKTDTGYKTVYSVVPYGTVYFSLNREYAGNANGNGSQNGESSVGVTILILFLVRFMLFVVAGGIAFIVIMVKKNKRI